jgi:hypothetical protein
MVSMIATMTATAQHRRGIKASFGGDEEEVNRNTPEFRILCNHLISKEIPFSNRNKKACSASPNFRLGAICRHVNPSFSGATN